MLDFATLGQQSRIGQAEIWQGLRLVLSIKT